MQKTENYIIEFPKCEFCGRGGALNIWKCRSCHKYTCNDCLVGCTTSDRCNHEPYKPVTGDSWNLE